MQIMINIPDEVWDKAKEYGHLDICGIELSERVMNGMPLPKGHGRLGDLDMLEKEIVNGIKAGLYEGGYEEYGHINDIDDCVECIKCTDTIIEADTESEVSQNGNSN